MKAALEDLGINADVSPRYDLFYKGKKISGVAMKQSLPRKNMSGYFLYHGTLLLDANIQQLVDFLTPRKLNIKAISVDSVRSKVCNLKEEFPFLTNEVIYDKVSQ